MKYELQAQLSKCSDELIDINEKLKLLSAFDSTTKYLTDYALIKTCGTIEYVYRSIVADFFSSSKFKQIHTYLEKTVRKGSMSATYDNMCKLLGRFDDDWEKNFKKMVGQRSDNKRLKDSLTSLVNNRHAFAHGNQSTATFQEIKIYYDHAIIIINIFDSAVV